MKNILTILFCLGALANCAAQKAGYFTNPILAGFYPDPSICRVGGDYYLVNSSFVYFPGLPIFHSKDLVNWMQIGNAMDRPEQLDTEGDGVSRGLFAPAINYYNGTFYIVCTNIDKGGNFIITAKNAAGPWSNPIWINDVKGIDPSIFFNENNKAFIVYNSGPPNNKTLWSGHRSIRMKAFDIATMQTIGEEILLVNGGADTTKKPVWIEGPHLYKINKWYYLMCAEGGTGDNHSEVVFRSQNVTGPFVPYQSNPILTQRQLNPNRAAPITTTGHADLVSTPDGEWYAVFLGCQPYESNYYNIGRETFLAPVTWTKDGWPVITKGEDLVKKYYPSPHPKPTRQYKNPYSGNINYTNNFTDSMLDSRLVLLRTPQKHWYNFKEKKGFLTMALQPETAGGKSNPSFVGFRQQQHNCTATTSLLFAPASIKEKAGLMIFQSENNFYFLCKSMDDNSPVVQLYQSVKDAEIKLLASNKLADNDKPLQLRISQSGANYICQYNVANDNKWITLGTVDATFLSTQTAGGFVGSVFALYATSLGEGTSAKAYFDWFKYKGIDVTR